MCIVLIVTSGMCNFLLLLLSQFKWRISKGLFFSFFYFISFSLSLSFPSAVESDSRNFQMIKVSDNVQGPRDET